MKCFLFFKLVHHFEANWVNPVDPGGPGRADPGNSHLDSNGPDGQMYQALVQLLGNIIEHRIENICHRRWLILFKFFWNFMWNMDRLELISNMFFAFEYSTLPRICCSWMVFGTFGHVYKGGNHEKLLRWLLLILRLLQKKLMQIGHFA